MTTEVAILNKGAVAMATDSAVTVTSSSPSGQIIIPKTYAQANKLFELVKGVPIGVMIYNSVELAGIPWETLIKSYRARRNDTGQGSVQDCVTGFLDFVQNCIEHSPYAISQDDQLAGMAMEILSSVVLAQIGPSMKSDHDENLNSLHTALDQFEDQLSKLDVDTWAQGLDEEALRDRMRNQLVQAFPNLDLLPPMSESLKTRIVDLLTSILLRRGQPSGNWTGVVVAGFGADALFPELHHVQVGGLVEGRMLLTDDSQVAVSNERPAIIQPFAQTDDAITFLRGTDPSVARAVTSFWQQWSNDLHTSVMEVVGNSDPSLEQSVLDDIGNKIEAFMARSWGHFGNYMEAQFHARRLEPIEASAAFLSKGEIADLAANLVDLTSLRNRVSLDRQETVGGATDVAVISLGDGFVWVKRKHYFDRDRNPSWAANQSLSALHSMIDRRTRED